MSSFLVEILRNPNEQIDEEEFLKCFYLSRQDLRIKSLGYKDPKNPHDFYDSRFQDAEITYIESDIDDEFYKGVKISFNSNREATEFLEKMKLATTSYDDRKISYDDRKIFNDLSFVEGNQVTLLQRHPEFSLPEPTHSLRNSNFSEKNKQDLEKVDDSLASKLLLTVSSPLSLTLAPALGIAGYKLHKYFYRVPLAAELGAISSSLLKVASKTSRLFGREGFANLLDDYRIKIAERQRETPFTNLVNQKTRTAWGVFKDVISIPGSIIHSVSAAAGAVAGFAVKTLGSAPLHFISDSINYAGDFLLNKTKSLPLRGLGWFCKGLSYVPKIFGVACDAVVDLCLTFPSLYSKGAQEFTSEVVEALELNRFKYQEGGKKLSTIRVGDMIDKKHQNKILSDSAELLQNSRGLSFKDLKLDGKKIEGMTEKKGQMFAKLASFSFKNGKRYEIHGSINGLDILVVEKSGDLRKYHFNKWPTDLDISTGENHEFVKKSIEAKLAAAKKDKDPANGITIKEFDEANKKGNVWERSEAIGGFIPPKSKIKVSKGLLVDKNGNELNSASFDVFRSLQPKTSPRKPSAQRLEQESQEMTYD